MPYLLFSTFEPLAVLLVPMEISARWGALKRLARQRGLSRKGVLRDWSVLRAKREVAAASMPRARL